MFNYGANVAVKTSREDFLPTKVGTYLPNTLRGGYVERTVKSWCQFPDLFLNWNLLKDWHPFGSRVAIKECIVSRHPEPFVRRESHVSNIGERLAVRSDHALSVFIGKQAVESLSEIISEHFAVGSGIDHVMPTCKFVPRPL